MTPDFDLPEPTDDFRHLTLDDLRNIRTNHIELKSIRRGEYAKWIAIPGYLPIDCFFYVIGFSTNYRFLVIALNYDVGNNVFTYHQVKLADEQEIKGLCRDAGRCN